MKRHWVILLLFFIGLVGAIALSVWFSLSSPQLSRTTSEPNQIEESPAASPSSIPQPMPSIPRPVPSPVLRPIPTSALSELQSSRPTPPVQPSDLKFAETAINNALAKLPQGEAYHNVPETMKVGIAEIVEAGIAPKVTEAIKQELQGKGKVKVQSGIRFDPGGVEMKLVVKPSEFEVFEVEGGKQFVTSSSPGKWIWEITPLTPGDHLIVVEAIVDLKVPELNVTHPIEVEVFRATRKVQVNPVYSTREFVSKNWKEIAGFIVGSGSLVSLITWWSGKKKK